MKHRHFGHLGRKVHSRFCIKEFGEERKVLLRGAVLKWRKEGTGGVV